MASTGGAVADHRREPQRAAQNEGTAPASPTSLYQDAGVFVSDEKRRRRRQRRSQRMQQPHVPARSGHGSTNGGAQLGLATLPILLLSCCTDLVSACVMTCIGFNLVLHAFLAGLTRGRSRWWLLPRLVCVTVVLPMCIGGVVAVYAYHSKSVFTNRHDWIVVVFVGLVHQVSLVVPLINVLSPPAAVELRQLGLYRTDLIGPTAFYLALSIFWMTIALRMHHSRQSWAPSGTMRQPPCDRLDDDNDDDDAASGDAPPRMRRPQPGDGDASNRQRGLPRGLRGSASDSDCHSTDEERRRAAKAVAEGASDGSGPVGSPLPAASTERDSRERGRDSVLTASRHLADVAELSEDLCVLTGILHHGDLPPAVRQQLEHSGHFNERLRKVQSNRYLTRVAPVAPVQQPSAWEQFSARAQESFATSQRLMRGDTDAVAALEAPLLASSPVVPHGSAVEEAEQRTSASAPRSRNTARPDGDAHRLASPSLSSTRMSETCRAERTAATHLSSPSAAAAAAAYTAVSPHLVHERIVQFLVELHRDTNIRTFYVIPPGVVVGALASLLLRMCSWSGDAECTAIFSMQQERFRSSVYVWLSATYWLLGFTVLATTVLLVFVLYYQQLRRMEAFTYEKQSDARLVGSVLDPDNLLLWVNVWKLLLQEIRRRPSIHATTVPTVLYCAVGMVGGAAYGLLDGIVGVEATAAFTTGAAAIFGLCATTLLGLIWITVRMQKVVAYEIRLIAQVQMNVQRQLDILGDDVTYDDAQALLVKINCLQALDVHIRTAESTPRLAGMTLETIRLVAIFVSLIMLNVAFFFLYLTKCYSEEVLAT